MVLKIEVLELLAKEVGINGRMPPMKEFLEVRAIVLFTDLMIWITNTRCDEAIHLYDDVRVGIQPLLSRQKSLCLEYLR